MKTKTEFALSFILLAIFLNACKASSSISSSTGSASTTFTTPAALQISPLGTQGLATELLIGKFTTDSYNDIVELTSTTGAIFYKSKAGGGWDSGIYIPAVQTSNTSAGVAVDVTGDGLLDLIVMKGSQIVVLKSLGDGTFTQLSSASPGRSVTGLGTGAFKTLSGMDWIFASTSSANPYFLNATSTSTTSNLSSVTDFGTAESNIKVLSSDFDGDQFVDAALVSSSAGHITVFKNAAGSGPAEASAAFNSAWTISPSGTIRDAAVAHLSSANDIVIATSNGLQLAKNSGANGTMNFSTPSTLAVNVDATSLLAADLTKDGKVDFFLTRNNASSVFYTQTGTLTFTDITEAAFGNSGLTAGAIRSYAADIDGDGVADLLELHADGTINIHINQSGK